MEGVGNAAAEAVGFRGAHLCTSARYSLSTTRLILIFWCLLVVLTLTPTVSFALEPVLQNGLNWLQGQVQTDGSLASESRSVATPFQARTETAYALRDFGVRSCRIDGRHPG